MGHWLDRTRLVEEVPGTVASEQYYIWHNRSIVWQGRSLEDGEKWAAENGITIDRIERFEP